MQKGIIFDIKRYAVHDGPGIRTTVFLKGCPARCWWCHNPESQVAEPEKYTRIRQIGKHKHSEQDVVGKEMTVHDVMTEIRKDTVFADESEGGVTFSGGEPLMQPEFLTALLKACRKEQIHTALDTTGYAAPEVFNSIAPLADLILFDLKIIDDGLHQIYTGVSNQQIMTNLLYLSNANIDYILRYPVIPGYTDDQENIAAMRLFMRKLNNPPQRIDLLPFHDLAKSKYHRFAKEDKFSDIKRPDKKQIQQIKALFESDGFSTGIGG